MYGQPIEVPLNAVAEAIAVDQLPDPEFVCWTRHAPNTVFVVLTAESMEPWKRSLRGGVDASQSSVVGVFEGSGVPVTLLVDAGYPPTPEDTLHHSLDDAMAHGAGHPPANWRHGMRGH